MWTRAGRSWLLAIALVLPVPGVARAEDETDVGVAAKARFEAGRRAYEAARYDEALAAFLESYQLLASPNSHLFVARCYEKLGKAASAFRHFRLTAREANDRLVATGEEKYRPTRDAALQEVQDLEPRVPRLVLAVVGASAADVVLKVNGEEAPPATWGTSLERDAGHIVVEAAGRRIVPFRAEADLRDGEQRRVDVALTRTPTALIEIDLRSHPPGLVVELDGVVQRDDDLDRSREVDAGVHTVIARAPGYRPFQFKGPLDEGQHTTVDVVFLRDTEVHSAGEPPLRAFETPRWAFFLSAGVGVGALGLATGLAVDAKAASDREQAKPVLQRDPGTRDRIATEATVANTLFVGGALTGALAVALAVTTRWRTPATAFRLSPWVGARVAGGGLTGSFP